MRSLAWLLVAAGIAVCRAPLAHAETAVLLPPSGDETLLSAQRQAHDAVRAALQQQGLKVLAFAEAGEKAKSPEARDCKTVDCAAVLLLESDVQLAAAVAVWASGGGQEVFVTLVDTRGHRFPGKAQVTAGELAQAATSALLDARALTLLGPGPWLHVHGKPEGAQVVLGGKVIGTMPMRATVASGRHVLEVRLAGHKPFVQTVDVPPNAARQVDVDVALQPRAGGSAAGEASALDAALMRGAQSDAGSGGQPSKVWSFLAGGALAATGAALIAYGIVNLATEGECAGRDAMGRCTQEVQPGSATTVALIAGGVALAGAVVMFAVQPIEVGGETSGAMASVRGNF